MKHAPARLKVSSKGTVEGSGTADRRHAGTQHPPFGLAIATSFVKRQSGVVSTMVLDIQNAANWMCRIVFGIMCGTRSLAAQPAQCVPTIAALHVCQRAFVNLPNPINAAGIAVSLPVIARYSPSCPTGCTKFVVQRVHHASHPSVRPTNAASQLSAARTLQASLRQCSRFVSKLWCLRHSCGLWECRAGFLRLSSSWRCRRKHAKYTQIMAPVY